MKTENKNPFDEIEFAYGEFKKHVKEQIEALDVAESLKLDYGSEPNSKARVAINKIAGELKRKFITRKDDAGHIWVKRTR